VVLDKIHNVTKSITAGAFAQDSWSVMDKVTVNLGVRYDAQFLYSSRGGTPFSLPNQWSPRIGAIYDPTQEGRAKVSVAFARFYEGVPLDIADRSLSRENSISGTQRTGTAANPCMTPLPGLPPTTQGPCLGEPRQAGNPVADPNQRYTAGGAGSVPIDPNIKPQSSDEIVLVGEYEFIRDGRERLSYTKRWMNYVIEDMSRDEAATYFLGNPGYGIAKDFPKPKRDYDAVTVYLTKVFSDEWLAQLSYTASYLRGNYAGLFRPETAQLNPNINSDFDLRSLLPNREGPLPGDRTHQIKLYGAKDWSVTPEHHLTTGLSLKGRSGTPTGYLGSHTLYGLDETFILPRGSGERTPWEFGADVQVGYRFNIDKDKTVQATIDIFNVFNFQAVTLKDNRYTASDVLPVAGGSRAADGSIPGLRNDDNTPFDSTQINPNFGRATAYQTPRVFRFGLRTTF
ncbi:MAG: TonB-dependent receptor, partial [Polyangiaceae bacterium]